MLQNSSDNYILKWLIAYKDYSTNLIKLNKSKQPLPKRMKINYYDFAKHICNVRNQLLVNKCEFYVITFDIPQNLNGNIIEYKNKYGNWQYKMRLIDNHGPYCK